MAIIRDTLEQTGIPRLIGWDNNNDTANEDSIVRKAVAAAIYPFQLATSPTAIKAYITTVLFLFTSFVLLSISTTAYAFFYYNYIPQTDLERPIYLQYDTEHYPHADIRLDSSALISQQPYDVAITLHMPQGPVNKASGNFMLDLTLHGPKDTIQSAILETVNMENAIPSTVLHRSRRPALMPYSSFPTSLIHKLIQIPFHLLTSSARHRPDSVTLTIPMFEEVEFARGKDNIPTHAKLTIQSQRPSTPIYAPDTAFPIPHLEVYDAKISFQVRFHGLRYLIYNHRILSFLVFSSLFYGVSISTVAVVWAALTVFLRSESDKKDSLPLVKQERSPKIKQEHETSDPLRTDTDGTVKTVKRISDDSEENKDPTSQGQGQARVQSKTTTYTPQTSETVSATSSQGLAAAPAPGIDSPSAPTTTTTTAGETAAVAGDVSEEQADDEDEEEEEVESEDEWEQLQRLRRRMERDAREREKQLRAERERDSGLGTSMESEGRGMGRGSGTGTERANDAAGAGGAAGLIRRRSSRRSLDEKE